METLKEMKVAMTASEMKHIVGRTEVDAINLDRIDDNPGNKVPSVSSDCPLFDFQTVNFNYEIAFLFEL
jgi:hypothetical protein